jgi:hypothetical protein
MLATFQIAKSDFDRSAGDFRPTCLGVSLEYRRSLGILDLKVQNSNDALVNLDVCHRSFSFLFMMRRPLEASVALTDLKTHVSMIQMFFPEVLYV